MIWTRSLFAATAFVESTQGLINLTDSRMQCLRRGIIEAAGVRGASRSLSSSSGGEGCSSGEVVKPKTGVLMLNMGGPRNSEEVHEFLGNLFADKDIIKLPVQDKV